MRHHCCRPLQQSRVEALKEARNVLSTKVGAFGGSNINGFDTVDIITLAEFILDGK
jgi:hypothetical protein